MSNITTDKEAFEFVSSRLLDQGDKCVDIGHDCQYRGFKPDETWQAAETEPSDDNDRLQEVMFELFGGYTAKCAAGWLIDDNFYDPSLEGKLIDDEVLLAIERSHPNWKMTEDSVEMIRVLQSIHDRENPTKWEKAFATFSDAFDENGNCTKTNWKENR